MSYRISYWLGGLLVAAAFIAQWYENWYGDRFRLSKNGPWLFFGAGILLIFIGWLEYLKMHRNDKK